MATHIYIAKAAGFSTHLLNADKERICIRFEEGQFQTDDDSIAEQLDKAIPKGLARHITKVDRAAAEALVAKHRAGMKQMGAKSGGVTALDVLEAQKLHMQQRDEELKNAMGGGAGADAALAELAPEGGILLTEEGKTEAKVEAAPTPAVGFKLSSAAK